MNWTSIAWVALVPLGLALRDKRGGPELYLSLYVGGLVFQLAHLDWVRSGTGSEWLSGPRTTQWLAQGTGLAVIWPVFFSLARVGICRTALPMTIVLPIVWVAFEFVRKHLWAIADATGYPFGQLGLTQVHHPMLIQVADVGGVYAVTALVAAVNGLIVDVVCWLARSTVLTALLDEPAVAPNVRYEQVHAPIWSFIGVGMTLAAVLTYGAWRVTQHRESAGPVVCLMPNENVAVITSYAPMEFPSRSARLLDPKPHSAHCDALHADLLVWSEGTLGRLLSAPEADENVTVDKSPRGNLATRKVTVNQLENYARSVKAALVVGCNRTVTEPGTVSCNSAAVIDPTRGYLGAYDKVWLVPFREFYPSGRPTFGDARQDRYYHGSSYPVFTINAGAARNYAIGISICFDTCFPEPYWRFMRATAGQPVPQFFVVPAYESHDRQMRLQDMLLRLAQFRAIECRRAFVRNAQGGYSGIIDGNGKLIAQPPEIDFDSPVVLGPMLIDDRFSLYSQLGDWLPISACAAMILLPLGQKLRQRYRRAV